MYMNIDRQMTKGEIDLIVLVKQSIITLRSPTLNTLKILNSLKALREVYVPDPLEMIISMSEMRTMKASKMLNLSLTNSLMPNPISLMITSNVKIEKNMKFVYVKKPKLIFPSSLV